jgi:hypothetical protein
MTRPRPALLAVCVVAVAIGLGGIASAASTAPLTLKLKGQYAKKHRTACGKRKHLRFFHRSSTVEWEGFLMPAPTKHFAARLELKRCVRGTWRKIGDRFTTGKPLTGKYKGFFRAKPLAPRSHKKRAVVYYRARTFVGTTSSDYEYFAVTN